MFHILSALLVVVLLTGCDALHTLTKSRLKTAQGRPYEMIVVCDQEKWTGEVGDTLRSVLLAEVPCLNQKEPLFDVLRVTERGFTGLVADHRNVMKLLVSPSVENTMSGVQYNVTAEPQLVMTVQAKTNEEMINYLSDHRKELVAAFEQAERDRSLKANSKFNEPNVERDIEQLFGCKMTIPKGFFTAKKTEDFLWARYEYPTASKGFMIYSYPYEGKQSLSLEALLKARNRYAKNIPGPSDGSYMITSEAFEPDFRMFRLEGRLWCEMRGFWDVEGDFMGGPFVSYTTVDTATNRVFTYDAYIYSPKLNKRNFVRDMEHLLYQIEFQK